MPKSRQEVETDESSAEFSDNGMADESNSSLTPELTIKREESKEAEEGRPATGSGLGGGGLLWLMSQQTQLDGDVGRPTEKAEENTCSFWTPDKFWMVFMQSPPSK